MTHDVTAITTVMFKKNIVSFHRPQELFDIVVSDGNLLINHRLCFVNVSILPK